jgi:ferredoxin
VISGVLALSLKSYGLGEGSGDDDEGYGQVLGDGIVPPGEEKAARLAVANCPERAIDLET